MLFSDKSIQIQNLLIYNQIDWNRIIPTNKKCVIFCKVLLKNDSTPYFERSIIIDEDATVQCKYLHSFHIDFKKLELNSNVILDHQS